MPLFCDVALPVPLDQTFTYAVNGVVPVVGARVLVPFSGQKLMGAWSDTPQNAVQYEDRIVHIWTNSGNNYLVAVHVQAPTGTPGFDAAAEGLTDDFDIALP